MIKKGETYIIGEIGQNHNGSVDIAKLITELVSHPVKDETFDIPHCLWIYPRMK